MSPLSAGTFLLCALVAFLIRRAEQQGQAPQGGQSHHHIDGPGDPGAGSAADEGHKVEIEPVVPMNLALTVQQASAIL